MVPTYGAPMMPAYGMMGGPMTGCVPVPCAMPTCPCLMRRASLDNNDLANSIPTSRRNANVQSGIQQQGSNNMNTQLSRIVK